jgi:hypothetical protein
MLGRHVVFAWSPPLDAFIALKMSKIGLEVRKLWPFEIEGGEGNGGRIIFTENSSLNSFIAYFSNLSKNL